MSGNINSTSSQAKGGGWPRWARRPYVTTTTMSHKSFSTKKFRNYWDPNFLASRSTSISLADQIIGLLQVLTRAKNIQNRSGLPYKLILCPISYLQQIKSRCYISLESHLLDILRYVLKTMGYQGACKCTTQNTAHTMMNGTFDQKWIVSFVCALALLQSWPKT